MKILGIVCSPRRNGNTEILVNEVLRSAKASGADETEIISVAGKNIGFCVDCNKCFDSGECAIKDDMQEFYAKMKAADGIVFGSPVYFRNVTGQAKTLIDRMRPFIRVKHLRDKVAATVVVAQRAGNTSAFAAFEQAYNGLRVIPAGGAMGYGYKKGEVLGDKRGMAEARAVGRVVVRFIKRAQVINRDDEIEKPMKLPFRLISSKTEERTESAD